MKTTLSKDQTNALFSILHERFEKNKNRHPFLTWDEVQTRLMANPKKLIALDEMELTGGEPDVVAQTENGTIIFFDCSLESPSGRRSLCYDRQALDARKAHKPENSVLDLAQEMGVDLLTEEQYKHLQTIGKFDQKTSSWVQTPDAIRKLGGAVFCDRRYDTVFYYHNGADSYYAARGFRASLAV